MLNNGAKKATLTVAGIPVTVKELTVQEIGQWLEDKTNPSSDSIENPLLSLLPVGDMMLGDLFSMTDLTLDKANGMTGSELETVLDKCKEVNKHFFALAATLRMAGAAALDQLSSSSTKTAPS